MSLAVPTHDSPATTALHTAAAVLADRIAPLAARTAGALTGEIAYYAVAFAERPDLRGSVHTALETGVVAMAWPSRFADSGEYARDLGSRRAAEGVPLATLNQAYRIGGQQIWLGLVGVAGEHAPVHTAALTHAAGIVWRHVDRDRELMTAAYHLACGESAVESTNTALLTLLHDGIDAIDVSGAAIALGLPLRGRYAVVRLRSRAGFAPLTTEPARQAVGDMTLYRLAHAAGETVLAELGSTGLDQLVDALRDKDVRGGVSSVRGSVAELGRAVAEADLAAATCTRDGEIAQPRRHAAAMLVQSRPDLASPLAGEILRRVAVAESGAAPLLWETLATWFDYNGCAASAADALACHRNTVTNRLRRLEAITGLSTSRPHELANLALALHTHRLLAPAR